VFTTGLILGFVFATTRSIWGCICLHWLNNALSQVT
jgi:membrane protease YdiL (CAAX protease family)